MDYNLDENKIEDEIIFNRSLQLKNLIENTRIKALENIEEGQERQKKIQNDRTNPTNVSLKEGDLVMIKCEGLLRKLESRYHGRFFIIAYKSWPDKLIKNLFILFFKTLKFPDVLER